MDPCNWLRDMDYGKAEGAVPPLAYQILTTTGGVVVVWCLYNHVWYILGGIGFALGLTLIDYKCNGVQSVRQHWNSLKYLFVVVGGSVSTWLVSNHPWYVLTGAISAAATNWWDFTLTYSAEFPSLFLSVGVGSHGYTQWVLFNYVWSRYIFFGLGVAAFVVKVHDGHVDYPAGIVVGGGAGGLLWLLVNYPLSRHILFGLGVAIISGWFKRKATSLTSKAVIAGTAAGISWVLLHVFWSWYFFLGFCLAIAIRSMTETPEMAFWFIAGGGGAATLWLLINDTWFFTVGLVIAAASALMTGFDEKDFPLYTFWLFTGIGSMSTWFFFNCIFSAASLSYICTAWEMAWHHINGVWTLYIILGMLTSLSAVKNLKMKAAAAFVYGGGVSAFVHILVNFSWPRYALLGMLVAGYVGGNVKDLDKFPASAFFLTAVGAGGIPWLLMNNHVSGIVALLLASGVCVIIALHLILKKLGGTNLIMTSVVVYLIVSHAVSGDSNVSTSCTLGEIVGEIGKITC